MGKNSNWTYEEHILAFNMYCKIPFGTIHMGNPKIVELAKLLGRSVGSVSYKLANFARLDPALHERGIHGLTHGAKEETVVWEEFAHQPEKLAFESERLLSERLHKPLIEVANIRERDLPAEGIEREALVRVRVNQNFFRQRILSAYDFGCCITGLKVQELLVASHIIPWSIDVANRLNPRNGLCLNAFHDRAFDRRLMWVEDGFIVRFSKKLRENAISDASLNWLTSYEGKSLRLPKHFTPDTELLRKHASCCQK